MYVCTCMISNFRVKWYCHFDDDVYVNVKELSKLLSQYNSSKPYYIGRNPRGPNGVKVRSYVCHENCFEVQISIKALK